MASIRVKLRESTVEGRMGKLFIQIIHKREIRIITTPFKLLPSEWDTSEQCLIFTSKKMGRFLDLCEIDRQLEAMAKALESIVVKLDRRRSYRVDDIIELYEGKSTDGVFFKFMSKVICELRAAGQTNTATKYEGAMRRFLDYRKGGDLSFGQVTPRLVKEYEHYLRARALTMNTVSFYMRILRAVYNRAVKAGVAPQSDPFIEVYTGVAKTVKRATTVHVIRELQRLILPPKLALSRDMFLFSLYARGMAYVDMANLKKSSCSQNVLSYERSKTGQSLKIYIEPCIEQIINRYADLCSDSESLLPIVNCAGAKIKYLTAISIHNRRLRQISKLMGLSPPLTSYVPRHTWASVARHSGVDIAVISESMGHTSENTTRIYLNSLDQSAIDQANRSVLLEIDNMGISIP